MRSFLKLLLLFIFCSLTAYSSNSKFTDETISRVSENTNHELRYFYSSYYRCPNSTEEFMKWTRKRCIWLLMSEYGFDTIKAENEFKELMATPINTFNKYAKNLYPPFSAHYFLTHQTIEIESYQDSVLLHWKENGTALTYVATIESKLSSFGKEPISLSFSSIYSIQMYDANGEPFQTEDDVKEFRTLYANKMNELIFPNDKRIDEFKYKRWILCEYTSENGLILKYPNAYSEPITSMPAWKTLENVMQAYFSTNKKCKKIIAPIFFPITEL